MKVPADIDTLWAGSSTGYVFLVLKGQPCSLKSRAESVSEIVNGRFESIALVDPDLFRDAPVDANLHI